jgi:hypothetical protein
MDMRSALRFVLVPLLLSCASEKAPYDAADLDSELTADDLKTDSVTKKTILMGEITAGVAIDGEFIAHRYVGYTFAATAGDRIDLALDATDGYSDPVLFVYGPRKPSGSWGSRIAMNDDAKDLNSRIVDLTLPTTGVYLIVAGEYWKDAGTFQLRLDMPYLPAGIGEGCGDGITCEAGLTCMTYCGISCAVMFSTCEHPCGSGEVCPVGTVCTTIYDGPGTVCRAAPTCAPDECSYSKAMNYLCPDGVTMAGPAHNCLLQGDGTCAEQWISCLCDTAACGPALGMPNTLCPDGVSVSGPTGRCLQNPDASCGWEVLSCPSA